MRLQISNFGDPNLGFRLWIHTLDPSFEFQTMNLKLYEIYQKSCTVSQLGVLTTSEFLKFKANS